MQQKSITVGELMDEYVQVYSLNHRGDSFLTCSKHRIEHYIKPYLGNVAAKELTTHDPGLFYDSLQDKPEVDEDFFQKWQSETKKQRLMRQNLSINCRGTILILPN